MGLQLIICVETNKKCNSDYIYIKTSIEHFYLTKTSHTEKVCLTLKTQ